MKVCVCVDVLCRSLYQTTCPDKICLNVQHAIMDCLETLQDKPAVIPEPKKERAPRDPREFNPNVMGESDSGFPAMAVGAKSLFLWFLTWPREEWLHSCSALVMSALFLPLVALAPFEAMFLLLLSTLAHNGCSPHELSAVQRVVD